ncbi:hypothetical protein L596_012454 [Steinernema carpocapsae]|uniref:Uncharacterized protein n=1 Tax=Steinernema carpocapsae TaxID=34508 RepID=A0A4U5NX82_STECR|nr:hypothetical protein L596_012454 [Steinernema carpocapsae]
MVGPRTDDQKPICRAADRISSVLSFIGNICKKGAEILPRRRWEITKILRPGNLGFYGGVIYNKGKEWFYVKARAMEIDTDDDNRNWGKVMDPVDGKIYENEFTNKEGEVKLISVVGGKRVYRRFCDNLMSKNIRFTYLLLHKSNNVTKYRNMKIKDPENLFCFFFENCEIAYSPVGAFNQVLVVPKVPIREPEPVSTSTATSTAAESFAHSSSSTETVSTTVSTQEVTSPSVSKTAATQETTTPKFSLLASTAFIIGVSVALVLLVVAIAVSCIVCRRRKKRKRSPSESTSATQVSSNVESGLALNDSKTSLVEAVTQQSSVIPGAQQPSLMKTQQPSLMKQTALQPLRRRSSIIQATQKNSLLDATTQMETAAQTPVKQSSSVLQAMHQSSKEKLA